MCVVAGAFVAITMATCVVCGQLLKQIRERWGKMCVLEWEAQQHDRKVQSMEAEINELKAKNMLWEQKYKAL